MESRVEVGSATRTELKYHEAAFLLRTSAHEVALAIRRGELAVVHTGRKRRVDPVVLEERLREDDDLLALAFLRRILSGDLARVPRARDLMTPAPSMTSYLELL